MIRAFLLALPVLAQGTVLAANSLYQLGGPSVYSPGDVFPPNHALTDGTNLIQGQGSATLTCFHDTSNIAYPDLVPWRPQNSTSSYGIIQDSGIDVVGSSGLSIVLEDLILDFDLNRASEASLGFSKSNVTYCGAFAVRNLTVRRSWIRGLDLGFLLSVEGASITLEKVTIQMPGSTKIGRGRNLIKATGLSSIIKLTDTSITSYTLLENLVTISGNNPTLTVTNLTVTNVTGAGNEVNMTYLPSPEENIAYNQSLMCDCRKICFDKSHYCLDRLAEGDQFNFHSFALFDVTVSTNASIMIADSSFTQVNSFVQGLILSLTATTGNLVSSTLKGLTIRESSLGDRVWALRYEATASPTVSPTHPPSLTPTGNPLHFTETLIGKTRTNHPTTVAPTFTATSSPTSAPTLLGVELGAYSGVVFLEGETGVVNISGISYKDDAMYLWQRYGNSFPGEPKTESYMIVKKDEVPRPCFVAQNTMRTAVYVEDLVIENAEMEAIIYDELWDPLNTQTDISLSALSASRAVNFHYIQGVVVTNATFANSGEFFPTPSGTTAGRYQGVVLDNDHPPAPLFLSNVTIFNADLSILSSVSSSVSGPASDELLSITITISDIHVSFAELYHPLGTTLKSGLINIYIPSTSGAQFNITMERSHFNNIKDTDSLISVGCVGYINIMLNHVSFSNVYAPSADNNSAIVRLPSCISQAVLTLDKVTVDGATNVDLVQADSTTVKVTAINSDIGGISGGSAVTVGDGDAVIDIVSSVFHDSSNPVLTLPTTSTTAAATQKLMLTDSLFENCSGTVSTVQLVTAGSLFTCFSTNFTKCSAFTDGSDAWGGAISSGGTIRVNSSYFRNNSAFNGGALFASEIIVDGSSFYHNFAFSHGGDIAARTATVLNTRHFYSSAPYGRGANIWVSDSVPGSHGIVGALTGVYSQYSKANLGTLVYADRNSFASIRNCKILNGVTSDAMIFSADSSAVEIYNSTFRDIISSNQAGMLHISTDTTAKIIGVYAQSFTVRGFGGLIASSGGATIHMSNSSVSNFTVQADGGIFYMPSVGALTVVNNSDFSDINGVVGGLTYILSGSLYVTNCRMTRFSVSSTGGVFHALGEAYVSFKDSTVDTANTGRGGLAHVDNNAKIYVSNVNIYRISAFQSAAIARVEETGYVELKDVTIEGGSSTSAGLYEMLDSSRALLERVTVQDYAVTVDKGLISVVSDAYVSIVDCSFNNNSHALTTIGGIIFTAGSGRVVINGTTFEDNQGGIAGVIAATATSTVLVKDSQFIRNYAAEGGGAIYVDSTAPLRFTNNNFTENIAHTKPYPVGVTTLSGNGGAILAVGGTDTIFSDCSFTRNEARRGGAVRIQNNATVRFEKCDFNFNAASEKGGAIMVYQARGFWSDCNIFNNTAKGGTGGAEGGGAAFEESYYSYFTRSVFWGNVASGPTDTSNKGGAVVVYNIALNVTPLAFLDQVHFIGNSAPGGAGGGYYWDRNNSEPTPYFYSNENAGNDNVTFVANTAWQGNNIASGLKKAVWDAGNVFKIEANLDLNFSLTINLTDRYGSHLAEPTFCKLTSERFEDSIGSGNFTGQYQLTSIYGVTCFGAGCVRNKNLLDKLQFVALPENNFTFRTEATANYTTESGTTVSYTHTTDKSRLQIDVCFPGQTIKNSRCTDCDPGYYYPFIPAEGTTCFTCPAGKFSSGKRSTGCDECGPTGGVAVNPGSSKCVSCDPNFVPNPAATECDPCPDKAEGTSNWWECECTVGYFAYRRDFKNRNPTECKPCPNGGNCDSNNLTDVNTPPAAGFWLSPYSKNELKFIECRNGACPGHREECARGYKGIMCTECIDGYGREGHFDCSRCVGGSVMATFRFTGAILLVCLIGIVMAIMNVTEAENEMTLGRDDGQWHRVATLAKITLSAAQFNSIAADFDYDWPPFVRTMLDTQGLIGDIGAFLSIDCAQGPRARPKPIYVETIIVAATPLVIPILAMIAIIFFRCNDVKEKKRFYAKREEKKKEMEERKRLGLPMEQPKKRSESSDEASAEVADGDNVAAIEEGKKSKKKKKKKKKRKKRRKGKYEDVAQPYFVFMTRKLRNQQTRARFYASLVCLFFMIYPSLVFQTFKLFNCERLGDSDDSIVLIADMSEICYQEPQVYYMVFLGFPMMVIYGFGFPYAMFKWLVKHKDDMPCYWKHDENLPWGERFQRTERTMPVYLFYHGFRPEFYTFEISIMVRKVLIAVFAIFVANPQIQALLAVLLVVISLMAQLKLMPFDDDIANNMELFALFTSFCIYFLGAFLYISSPLAVQAVSMLIVMITAAFYAMVIWLVVKDTKENITAWMHDRRFNRRKKEGLGQYKPDNKVDPFKLRHVDAFSSDEESEDLPFVGAQPYKSSPSPSFHSRGRPLNSQQSSGLGSRASDLESARSGMLAGKEGRGTSSVDMSQQHRHARRPKGRRRRRLPKKVSSSSPATNRVLGFTGRRMRPRTGEEFDSSDEEFSSSHDEDKSSGPERKSPAHTRATRKTRTIGPKEKPNGPRPILKSKSKYRADYGNYGGTRL